MHRLGLKKTIRSDQGRRDRGAHGEALAAKFLEEQGMQILQRNFRNRYGEVDIIVRDGSSVGFVEVKTWKPENLSQLSKTLGKTKCARMRVLAQDWLQTCVGLVGVDSLRLDLCLVDLISGSVEYFPSALDYR